MLEDQFNEWGLRLVVSPLSYPRQWTIALAVTTIWGALLVSAQQTNGTLPNNLSTERRSSQTDSFSQTQSANATNASAAIEIAGRVLDSRNHEPIARALVHLGGRAVLTDHDGVFRFPEVSGSSGSFNVSKPGYYSDRDGDVNIPRSFRFPVSSPIELLLFPEAFLSGTAVDAAGESMAHMSVVARKSIFDENGHRWLPAGQTQTTSDGSFRLPVPAGYYSILVSQRGRSPSGKEVVLPLQVPSTTSSIAEAIHVGPGEEVHLNLRPETRKAYQVSLTVEPELRGFPVLAAHSVTGTSIPLSPMPLRGEDRNGLRVALPSGTYTLIGSMQNPDGLSEAKTQITVTDHDLTGNLLRFVPAASLPVVVEADSSITSDNTTKMPDPIQLGLTLLPATDNPNGNGQTYRVTARRNGVPAFSLPDGTYHLRGQAGGQWSVTSASCGGVDLLLQDLPISSDMSGTEIRVRVSNRTANLTGSTAVNGVAGAAWIYLIATTPSATPVVVFRSGSDGRFFRPYLPVGSYRAIALESKVAADFQASSTLDKFLDRLQSFSVSSGEQRTLNLIAVPEQELPQ